MNKCTQCDRPGTVFKCNRWICDIHFRIQCMRDGASLNGKVVPTKQSLLEMAESLECAGMTCCHCSVVMVWRGIRGQPNVVSLQHDRSGHMRLLCKYCNNVHQSFPGDTFYDFPAGWRYCPKCKSAKSPDNFYQSATGRRKSYCKECRRVITRDEWARKRGSLCER